MIRFRHASLSELETILGWAASEGWNPGLEDAAAFYGADPAGFFVAAQDNNPVAGISVVNHNDDFAFLGLYLVRSDLRGQGIGFGLWQHALEHAGKRTVGLDGVPDQEANYAESGFVKAGATTRFSGTMICATDVDLRFATRDDISALIEMEAVVSGVRKSRYMGAWLQETDTRKTILAKEQGKLCGFCTVRQCQTGAKIGPLIADGPETAERLMFHAASVFEGEVILDVPDSATDLAVLCQRHGMVAGFRTARMYRGPHTRNNHRLYAVTSLELG